MSELERFFVKAEAFVVMSLAGVLVAANTGSQEEKEHAMNDASDKTLNRFRIIPRDLVPGVHTPENRNRFTDHGEIVRQVLMDAVDE